VDDIGDIRSLEPFFLPEKQMQKLSEAQKTDPIDEKVRYIGGG